MRNFVLKLLLSLSLFFPTTTFAVTEFVVSINRVGEDYNSLTTAESALDAAGDLTDGTVKTGSYDAQVGTIPDSTAVTWDAAASSGTLVHQSATQYLIDVAVGTLDDNDTVDDGGGNTFDVMGAPDSSILAFEVYADQGVLDESPRFLGNTSDATNHMIIRAPSGQRHNGTEFSGATVTQTLSATEHTLDFQEAFIQVEWLVIIIDRAANALNAINLSAAADNVTVNNNVIVGITTGSCILTQGDNLFVFDNIIYDCGDNGVHAGTGEDGQQYYNNTIFNVGNDGLHINTNGTHTVTNNLSIGSADLDYAIADATSTTNGSSDATGTAGLQSLTTSEFVSVTGGSEDLHLAKGATSVDAGTDLGTTPSGVEIDIDERDRDAEGDTWDLGADEFLFITEIIGSTLTGSNIK